MLLPEEKKCLDVYNTETLKDTAVNIFIDTLKNPKTVTNNHNKRMRSLYQLTTAIASLVLSICIYLLVDETGGYGQSKDIRQMHNIVKTMVERVSWERGCVVIGMNSDKESEIHEQFITESFNQTNEIISSLSSNNHTVAYLFAGDLNEMREMYIKINADLKLARKLYYDNNAQIYQVIELYTRIIRTFLNSLNKIEKKYKINGDWQIYFTYTLLTEFIEMINHINCLGVLYNGPALSESILGEIVAIGRIANVTFTKIEMYTPMKYHPRERVVGGYNHNNYHIAIGRLLNRDIESDDQTSKTTSFDEIIKYTFELNKFQRAIWKELVNTDRSARKYFRIYVMIFIVSICFMGYPLVLLFIRRLNRNSLDHINKCLQLYDDLEKKKHTLLKNTRSILPSFAYDANIETSIKNSNKVMRNIMILVVRSNINEQSNHMYSTEISKLQNQLYEIFSSQIKKYRDLYVFDNSLGQLLVSTLNSGENAKINIGNLAIGIKDSIETFDFNSKYNIEFKLKYTIHTGDGMFILSGLGNGNIRYKLFGKILKELEVMENITSYNCIHVSEESIKYISIYNNFIIKKKEGKIRKANSIYGEKLFANIFKLSGKINLEID